MTPFVLAFDRGTVAGNEVVPAIACDVDRDLASERTADMTDATPRVNPAPPSEARP